MSHSRRHTLILGIACCDSEKQDKRLANRAWRRAIHIELSRPFDWGDFCYREEPRPNCRDDRLGWYQNPNNFSNPWCFGKDGKHWHDAREKWVSYRTWMK